MVKKQHNARLQKKPAQGQAEPAPAEEVEVPPQPLRPAGTGEGLEPDAEGAGDLADELPGEPWGGSFPWQASGPPGRREIAADNERMQRRQRELRLAADYVARAFAVFPEVQRIVLFGSVAVPLRKEVPRFREYRRAAIAIGHECKDVDLAVWLTDLGNLRALGKTRSRAVNQLLAETGVGVAHHQVDVFVMEPGMDRYLGRLCRFGECPKSKRECLVPGCGEPLFLRQHEGFTLRRNALRPKRTVVRFEREVGTAGPDAGEMPS
jgi:hypothetical protein